MPNMVITLTDQEYKDLQQAAQEREISIYELAYKAIFEDLAR